MMVNGILPDSLPTPWWHPNHPLHVGDAPNPPIQVGDFPYAPDYPGNFRPSTGNSTTQYIHIEPDFATPDPDYELTWTDNETTWYDLSGKKVAPKEKSVITKDALAISRVTEGNEFLIIASTLVGVADTVNAVKHFIGLWHLMSDEVETKLEDVLYGNDPNATATWQIRDTLLVFQRTTLVVEE